MVATLKTVKDNRKYLLTKALPYLFVLSLLVMCFMSVYVFAATGSGAAASGTKAGIEAVVKIIMVLLSALGALFIVLGVIKFTIAHAQEDSPSQQKAAMLIASGIALLIVGFVVGKIDFANIINVSPSYSYSGTFGG